ncbi:MAG: hypothetical protein HY606_15405 [Planctomycetes bacterium]|nr:hypothetical protein [Planctomycetota bacterium]
MLIFDDGRTSYFDPMLGPPIDISNIVIPSEGLVDVVFFDLNNDGISDHLTRHISVTVDAMGVYTEVDKISIFLNNGFPFTKLHEYSLPDNSFWLVDGDADGDLDNDIVCSIFDSTANRYDLFAFVNNSGSYTAVQNVGDKDVWEVFKKKTGAKIKKLPTWKKPAKTADSKYTLAQNDQGVWSALNLIYSVLSLSVQNHPNDPNAKKVGKLLGQLAKLAQNGKIFIKDHNKGAVLPPGKFIPATTDLNTGAIYIDKKWTDASLLQQFVLAFLSVIAHELGHSLWKVDPQDPDLEKKSHKNAFEAAVSSLNLLLLDYGMFSQALNDRKAEELLYLMYNTGALQDLTQAYGYDDCNVKNTFGPKLNKLKSEFGFTPMDLFSINVLQLPQKDSNGKCIGGEIEIKYVIQHQGGIADWTYKAPYKVQ